MQPQFDHKHNRREVMADYRVAVPYMQNPKMPRAPKSGPLMAIMALLLPRGSAHGLGGDSDGVNGSDELGCTCATPLGGLGLAVQICEYAHHPTR